jgi:erythrin-vacuolar iron transport family protein
MRNFNELSEREVLALAITNEEEDGRIYLDFADRLHADYPASAAVFTAMAAEESEHRRRLFDIYRQRFGEHIPLIRRQDVRGFIAPNPIWQLPELHLDQVRHQAELMEVEAARFYRQAASRATDASVRQLLIDLAEAEVAHEHAAEQLTATKLTDNVRAAEDETARRLFVLRYVQPGLVGLMDGSVSTLAPLFAAAFATHNPWETFLVGVAASVGAGISMGMAEGLSDNGSLTGRGAPWIRGLICGVMTMLGGIFHALPYMIPNFWTATALAFVVVGLELAVITWIRWRYMDSPPFSAALQVGLGGALVFASGVLIGSG